MNGRVNRASLRYKPTQDPRTRVMRLLRALSYGAPHARSSFDPTQPLAHRARVVCSGLGLPEFDFRGKDDNQALRRAVASLTKLLDQRIARDTEVRRLEGVARLGETK